MERWLPVVGAEARYEVSDLGRVRSLAYRGGSNVVVLKGTSLSGYVRYQLATVAGKRFVFGHILVLEAFVGPCPSPRHEGCHGNGRRDDNALSNLRWDTPEGNQADRLTHGTHSRGERSGKARITEDQAREIIARRRAGEAVLAIAKDYAVGGRTIYQIASGERWSHLQEPST